MQAKPARDIHLHPDADEALQFDAAAPPAKKDGQAGLIAVNFHHFEASAGLPFFAEPRSPESPC